MIDLTKITNGKEATDAISLIVAKTGYGSAERENKMIALLTSGNYLSPELISKEFKLADKIRADLDNNTFVRVQSKNWKNLDNDERETFAEYISYTLNNYMQKYAHINGVRSSLNDKDTAYARYDSSTHEVLLHSNLMPVSKADHLIQYIIHEQLGHGRQYKDDFSIHDRELIRNDLTLITYNTHFYEELKNDNSNYDKYLIQPTEYHAHIIGNRFLAVSQGRSEPETSISSDKIKVLNPQITKGMKEPD